MSTFSTLVYDTPEEIGQVLARRVLADIVQAGREKRSYLLGGPTGRTPMPFYEALATQAAEQAADLSHVILVMMDEFLIPSATSPSGWAWCPEDAHYSCRGFVQRHIAGPLNLLPDQVWFPHPDDPGEHDRRIVKAGGIDFFLLASGASDGHVAFVRRYSDPDAGSGIVALSPENRHDNMDTFPGFKTLDEVPTHGVSVGLGTISRLSKNVAMVMHGPHKQLSARRVINSPAFEPDWPATIVHNCPPAPLYLDRAAAGMRPKIMPKPAVLKH